MIISRPPDTGSNQIVLYKADDGTVQMDMLLQFRIWATNVLRGHLIDGYTLHQKRLQEQGTSCLKNKFYGDIILTFLPTDLFRGPRGACASGIFFVHA